MTERRAAKGRIRSEEIDVRSYSPSMHSSAILVGSQPAQTSSDARASAAVYAVRLASYTSPNAIRTLFQFSP